MIKISLPRILALLSMVLGTWLALQWLAFPSWVGQPPLWLQANLQTSLMLVVMGIALFLRASSERSTLAHRAASAIALAGAVFGAVVLLQSLLGLESGFDLPRPRDTPSYFTPHPGRMSPNSCLAFIAVGAALWLAHPARIKRYAQAHGWALVLLVSITSVALIGHLIGLEQLYRVSGYNQMSYPSVIGLLILTLGLWYLRTAHEKTGGSATKDPLVLEQRITRRAVITLTLVAVGGGLAGFTAMRETFERSVFLATEQATASYSTALENTLDTSLWFPTTVASRPTVTQTVAALNTNPNDSAAREFLPKLAASFLTADIDGVRFFDSRGEQLISVGKFVGDKTDVINVLKVAASSAALRWNDGYLLRTDVPIVHDGKQVGTVSTEQSLEMFDRLIAQWRESTESADILICSEEVGQAVCAPTRFYAKAYTIAMRNARGDPNLPMNRALLGQKGVSHAVDLRGVPVVAGFAPIGTYGLGLVIKNDVATLYAPLRGQFYLIVVIVGVLVAAGTLALRARVKPLLATIVEEQQRTKSILDTAGDAFIALDADAKVSDWNLAAEQMFGWTSREAIGRSLTDLIVPAVHHRAHVEGFKRFRATGKGEIINRRSDLIALHKDGSEIPVEMMVTAQKVEGGFAANAFLRDVRERNEAQQKVARSEQRLKDVLASTPALVCHFDLQQRCIFTNDTGQLEGRISPEDSLGTEAKVLLGPVRYALHLPYILEALVGKRTQFEGFVNVAGRDKHFQSHLIPEYDDSRKVIGFYLISFDVTTLKELQFQSERDERRLRAITDNLPVMISYIDREHRFRFLNKTFEEWTGVQVSDAIGKPMQEVLGSELYAQRVEALRRSLHGERVQFEVTSHAAGLNRILQTVYIPDMASVSEVAGVYALSTDVTAIRQSEQEMAGLAMTDTVTGIANRRQFDVALLNALTELRGPHVVALMFLDVDHFKSINDTHGHAMGDSVLIEFANRLKKVVGDLGLPARIAGDEFAVVLPLADSTQEVIALADRLQAALRVPIVAFGSSLDVTSSVGIAVVKAGSEVSPQQMLAAADHALYECKRAGRNQFAVYSVREARFLHRQGLASTKLA